MASQNIARLGVVLGIDTAEFQAGVDKAIAENKKLKASIQRETNAAAKEIVALKYATEDYGKSVSKVTEVQREIAAGKFKNATEQTKTALLQQAAAYDKVAMSQGKLQQSTIKTFQMNQQQLAALGYQTTDIVTGLVSGQNPLLVLIQQGGQLRDQFGGFGNLMKGIASQITVARVAFVGLAGALGTLGLAYYKGSEQFKEFQNNLLLTNNLAGVTYDQVRNIARTLSSDFNITVGAARDVLNALVSSGRFTSQSLYSVADAIARISKLTGESADQVAKDLIPSFDGSAASAKRLNEQYNFLSIEQYRQIELLAAQGEAQKAAALTADLLTDSLSKQNRQVGWLEKGYNGLKQAFSSFWNSLKEIGTPLTDEQKLVQLARGIEQLQQAMTNTKSANIKKDLQMQIEDSIKQASELSTRIGEESARRIVAAETAAREKAKIDQYAAAGGLSKERSLNAEIEKNAIKASIEEFRKGVDERARIELDAQEQMHMAIIELNKKNQQENNVFKKQNDELYAQQAIKIYADMEEKKAEISRQAAKEVRERQATEESSILMEREKLDIYRQNVMASQVDLDVALNKLAVEKEIAKIARDTRLSPEAKAEAIARQQQIGADREEIIKLGEELTRLKKLNDSVWQNMSNAIDTFVRTGKFSFKDLARSIIQDLIAIQLKAQATKLFSSLVGSVSTAFTYGTTPGSQQTSMLAAQDAGFRAAGGDVMSNTPYVVGEQGPELFVPRNAGTIVPNSQMSSVAGTTNITNNYINAIDTKSFEDRLMGSYNAVWAANTYANKSLQLGGGRA